MVKPILLTPIAESDLEHLADYLIENWGVAVCHKFLDRFEETCDLIAASPGMFRQLAGLPSDTVSKAYARTRINASSGARQLNILLTSSLNKGTYTRHRQS